MTNKIEDFVDEGEYEKAIEEGIKAADEGRVETLESVKEKWRHKRMVKYWEDNKESFKKALQHDDGTVYIGVIAGK